MTENNIKEIQSCIRKNAIGVSAEIQSCIRKNAIGVGVAVGVVGGILLANISTATSQMRGLQESVDKLNAKIDRIAPTRVAQDTSKTNAVLNAVQKGKEPQKQ